MAKKQKTIIERLQDIYTLIPDDVGCKHCHHCCGPIVWFKPEDENIRTFLKKNKMEYMIWTTEEFKKNNDHCPYLKQDRCSIYPVRPIVCRLQGTIAQLPCHQHATQQISKQQHVAVKRAMDALVKDCNGVGLLFGTRKFKLK